MCRAPEAERNTGPAARTGPKQAPLDGALHGTELDKYGQPGRSVRRLPAAGPPFPLKG